MNIQKRTVGTLITLAALLGSAAALPAAAKVEADALGDDYHYGDYGRVRYDDNGVTVERADASQPGERRDEIGINAPIFPGDLVRTAGDQRSEIELAGGTVVRLDRGTEVTFLALPAPDASYADNTILQLHVGSLRIDARIADGGEFRVDTEAGSVYLLEDGDYRIETSGRGETTVWSWHGVAELSGADASTLVRSGMRASLYAGETPERARAFNTLASDSFDRWVADREDAYRVRDRYADYDDDYDEREVYDALPVETRPYYAELSAHGRWIYVRDYGWTWSPRGVAVDWRPYTLGYWNYGRRGYFWVSRDPWGWAPYRYGRWNYLSDYGWCWIPGRVFGGAWVSWSWGSAYVGWAPLDYWNRPTFIGRVHYGYYDPSCWSFVSYSHFYRRPRLHRYHTVGWDVVSRRVPGHAVVTRAPRVAPGDLRSDATARDRAFREAKKDVGRRIEPLGVARRGNAHEAFGETERDLRKRNAATRRSAPEGQRSAAIDRRPGIGRNRDFTGGKQTAPPQRTGGDRTPRRGDALNRGPADRGTRGDTPQVTPRRNPSARKGGPAASPRPSPRRTEADRRPAPSASRDKGNRVGNGRAVERTQERRRELYRGVTRDAQPKPSRRPAPSANRPAPAPRRPSARTPAPAPRRPSARPAPAPRRPAPSAQRPSSPAPRPRPQARPAPRSGGGGSKAAPKRGSSSGSRSGGSKAKPSGSGNKSKSRGKGSRGS